MAYTTTQTKSNALVDADNGRLMISQVPGSYWIKITKTYSDLAIAATSNNIELYQPGLALVKTVIIKHSTAFSGTGITAYTASVGIANGSAPYDEYMPAFNVFQAVSDTAYDIQVVNDIRHWSGIDTSIGMSVTSTGANLNAATAGSVTVWVELVDFNDCAITP